MLGSWGSSGRSRSVWVSAFCNRRVCVWVPCDVTVGAGCRGCRPIAFIRPISLWDLQSVLLFLQTRHIPQQGEWWLHQIFTQSSGNSRSDLICTELNSPQGWRNFRWNGICVYITACLVKLNLFWQKVVFSHRSLLSEDVLQYHVQLRSKVYIPLSESAKC